MHKVHCDLWGPVVISSQNFRYYALFVDDHTRFSWLFPLKRKFNFFFFTCFLIFQRQVENQFGKRIKILQSNGGGEVTIASFINHLGQCGIVKQIPCPATAKFKRKTYPCVFIDYSPLHKGYRCLEPQTNCVYTIKHVIFDEHEFLFATHTISSVQEFMNG